MPAFGATSQARLATCHPLLQDLMSEVVKFRDCTVLYGHRDQQGQDAAFAAGHSGCKWPQSPHNASPSLAVDVGPWPLDWNDLAAWEDFGQFVLTVARRMAIPVRWGRDFIVNGRPLRDYPHFELIKSQIGVQK